MGKPGYDLTEVSNSPGIATEHRSIAVDRTVIRRGFADASDCVHLEINIENELTDKDEHLSELDRISYRNTEMLGLDFVITGDKTCNLWTTKSRIYSDTN